MRDLYQVDVFTTEPYRGNPVAVVLDGTGLSTAQIRRTHGLEGGPWILTVARLDWHKGLDTVIRALPAVRAVMSSD